MSEEKTKEIILDPKDMDVIERFFTHFDIKIPDYLKESIDSFRAKQTLETQDAVKLSLTKAVRESENEMLAIDEIFEPVIKACGEVAYNMQFDKDLAETIGQDEEDLTDQTQSSSQ